MVTFDFNLNILAIIFLAAALLAGIVILIWGLAPQRRTGKQPLYREPEPDSEEVFLSEEAEESSVSEDTEEIESAQSSESSDESEEVAVPMLPKISVIAYTPAENELLDGFIESVSGQDYPNVELVLVVDAGLETRDMLMEKYSDVANLYLTFMPPGSQNLSRHKLAITLGMKAAKGEVALITDSNSLIPSRRWLSGMMQPFLESRFISVVLGVCHPGSVGASGLKGLYRRWYAANTTMQWIGYALDGKPYRGDGMNLAFRRRVFFDHKGFASTVSIHGGADDLFVKEISDAGNTCVVLSPDTILTADRGVASSKVFIERRASHDFTSKWLPRGPFMRAGLLSSMQWLLLAGCVAGSILSLPNLLGAAIGLLLLLCFFATEIIIWSRGYNVLFPSSTWFSTPLFLLWKPIGNFCFRMRHRSERIKNYTWRLPHTRS